MKIGRWEFNNQIFEGYFTESEAVPLNTTIQELLDLGLEAAINKVENSPAFVKHKISDIQLLAPLKPTSVRDGVAFEAHVEGVVKSVDNSEGVTPEWYDFPTFYFTNPHAIIGTDCVMSPPPSERLDYELELAVIIGKTPSGKESNLTPEEAKDAIFGYAIMNDWSARDIQAREMKVRLGPAKGKDFASTVGPWIVTADEFEDKLDQEGFLHISMKVKVNGEMYGEDSAANIGWPLNEMVAYASRNTFVKPGDLIGSGTCGDGCLAEAWGRAGKLEPAPLKAGDKVEMTIEGIGTITNTVGEPIQGPPIPPARKR